MTQLTLSDPGGLPMQVDASSQTADHVTEATRRNAVALSEFSRRVREDVESGKARSLMMPVRDGMLAVALGGTAR